MIRHWWTNPATDDAGAMTSSRSRLVTRFVVALSELGRRVSYGWPRANDVARYGGVPLGKLDSLLPEAVATGLVERHADDAVLVKLTDAGLPAARQVSLMTVGEARLERAARRSRGSHNSAPTRDAARVRDGGAAHPVGRQTGSAV